MPLNYLKKEIDRVFYVVFFACAFSVLGYFIPEIYYHHIDRNTYFEIRQPVSVEYEQYRRGDPITFIINRRSDFDMNLTLSSEIVHVNGDFTVHQLEDHESPRYIAAESTDGKYQMFKSSSYTIPCDAMGGRNLIRVVAEYEVRGVPKNYAFLTEIFEVSGENPDCKKVL